MARLKKGTVVTVSIPFTYTIGDDGYYSGKPLNSIEDMKDEVKAEIESGCLNQEVYIEVNNIEDPS